MLVLSRPQCMILQVLADADEPLGNDAIRHRYGTSPTATLSSLERRGLVKSVAPPMAERVLNEWFCRRWTITPAGRRILSLPEVVTAR